MPTDPLMIIATSYRELVLSQRLAVRLQGFALTLLGLALLGLAFLVWQGTVLLANTQTIAAQTQVMLERLEKR